MAVRCADPPAHPPAKPERAVLRESWPPSDGSRRYSSTPAPPRWLIPAARIPDLSADVGPLVVRRETGKEQEVEVLYDEDIASHVAPEPCVVSREGQGEASAGAHAGWPLSRERALSRAPTGLPTWKATRLVASSRAAGRLGVVRDPSMHGHSLIGNREVSFLAGGVAHGRSALGRGQTRSQR